MRDGAVTVVDVIEGWDRAGDPDASAGCGEPDLRRCNYRAQLEALLDGRIDAMFGKGLELALLERAAGGRIRLLYDVASSSELADRVNSSTPRLVTAGGRLVNDEREVVIRYLQGLLRAAAWAPRHAPETRNIVARECAVEARAIDHYLPADYTGRLMPAITAELLGTVEVLKSFLLERGFLAGDFALAEWVDPEPLLEAHSREQGAVA
jgi:ABC-type nitrate/sulfonate/bicarbonate transport system substrate-binding protein